MPVHDGARYLEQTLHSLLTQSFSNFELIISDNASQDETRAICEEYAGRDRRIRFHRFEENVGAARNYNHVFQLASGRYFKWAAHDDLCLPDYLRKCVDAFSSAAPSVVVVYPQTQLIDAENRVIGRDEFGLETNGMRVDRRLEHYVKTVRLVNPLLGLIRRDALLKTRLIGSFCSSDKVLAAELLMLGDFLEIPEVLFQRRIHEKSSWVAHRTEQDRRGWFDPAKRDVRPIVSADRRLTFEYALSACRMPLPFIDRLRCLAAIARTRLGSRSRRAIQRYARGIRGWFAPAR